MFDLVVSGGAPGPPGGAESVDLGVKGGKIAAIGAPGSLAAIGAGRVVDASGQIVIPGGIDPHIHCSMPMQMPNQPEPTVTGPPEQVSRAARIRRCDRQSNCVTKTGRTPATATTGCI